MDPLGPAALVARKESPGDVGTHGPPVLPTKPPRLVEPQSVGPDHTAFTKAAISLIPKPEYPLAALQDKIEGDVILNVTFDKSGHVVFRSFVQQLKDEELNTVARETVERIKFSPAKRDGVSVDQDAVITFAFRLTQLTLTASF